MSGFQVSEVVLYFSWALTYFGGQIWKWVCHLEVLEPLVLIKEPFVRAPDADDVGKTCD